MISYNPIRSQRKHICKWGVEEHLGVRAAEIQIIAESQISIYTTVKFISNLVNKTFEEINN